MNDNAGFVLGIVAVLLIAIVGGAFYIRQYNDCNAKGGVLVENAYDWPTCVSMTTK